MARNSLRRSLSLLACLALVGALGSAADDAINPIGRPEQFKQGRRTVYAIWFDDGVWNLQVTSPDSGKKAGRKIFSGRVEVDGDFLIGEFQGLDKAKKAKDTDWIVPHPDRKGFDFQFATFGKTDGVNFKVGPKSRTITFNLLVGGDDDPDKILIGAKGARPDKAKFTLPANPAK